MKKYVSLRLTVILVAGAVLATLFVAYALFLAYFRVSIPLRQEVIRFIEVREIISARYIGEQDEGALTEAALRATVSALGDPWTHYLNAEEYAQHLRHIGNQQQGIGINFSRNEESNTLLIVAVTPGSPAEEAGLVGGDTILTVAGEDTAQLDTQGIRERIGAHYGGQVALYVAGPNGDTRMVYVEVRQFFVNPVRYELKPGNIGYIQLANFDVRSGELTIEAIESLLEQGAQSLLFDLRFNPGGRVTELLAVLDHLLPEGELFVFEDQRGQETIHYAGPAYLDVPMVVLINGHSSSAAEFFAAILQESDWATIIGTPTTGKGRSQMMFPLSSGSALLLSTSRYLTPGRVDLDEAGGIQPDILVESGEGYEDLQLEYALAYLQR